MIRGKSAVVLFALLLAGCGFFNRTKSRIFSLERVAPAAPVTVRGLPVGIDAFELPPGFERKEIVVRNRDLTVEVRERDQWSGQFEPMVLHTLASNLADRLPNGMVVLPGQAKPVAMRSIDVVFEELAATADRAIVIDARWTLRERGTPAVAFHERIRVDLESVESAAIAAGMSRALGQLADRIATQLAAR